MPKRVVKVKLSYELVIDNDRDGIPWIPDRDIAKIAFDGCKGLDGITEIRNVKLEMGLDRQSVREMLVRDKVIREKTKR